MSRHQQTSTSMKTIQDNILSSNKLNKAPLTNPGEMKIGNLSDREFKIAILRKLSEIKTTQRSNAEVYQINLTEI